MDTLDYIVISIGVLLFIGLCVYIYIVLIAASTPNSTPNSTTNSTTLPDNSTNTISKDNQTPV